MVARATFLRYTKIMEYCLSAKFYNDNYEILSLRVKRSNPQPLLISSFIKNKKNSQSITYTRIKNTKNKKEKKFTTNNKYKN